MSHHAEIDTNSVARALHELGLAAWFGGALMGAVALNPASGQITDPNERLRVANIAWGRWTPVAAAAIAAHLIGAVRITTANASRIAAQQGVGTVDASKAVVTAAALGAYAASGLYGRKVMQLEQSSSRGRAEGAAGGQQIGDGGIGGTDVRDATTPEAGTDAELADAQRKLSLLQWAIPVLTGGLIVLSARLGEQQRPAEVAAGILDRFLPGH